MVSFRCRNAALGYIRKTTVVGFRWRTAVGFERRTTVDGFKWRTLVVSGLLQVNNYSGWLQMKNGGDFPRRTTVVNFKWKTTVISP